MNIGCVGAGFIGRAVAKLAVEHGHQVMLSNSRGPRTLTSSAIAVRAGIGTVTDAVAFGDLVLLAIPFYAVGDLDPAPFPGKIVMDACNHYPGRDDAVPALDTGSTTTSEIVQRHLAGAMVVKAWNATSSRTAVQQAPPTAELDRPLHRRPRLPGASKLGPCRTAACHLTLCRTAAEPVSNGQILRLLRL